MAAIAAFFIAGIASAFIYTKDTSLTQTAQAPLPPPALRPPRPPDPAAPNKATECRELPGLERRNVAGWLQLVAAEEKAMQALTLMVVYVLTTTTVQFIGFLISRLVDYELPSLG